MEQALAEDSPMRCSYSVSLESIPNAAGEGKNIMNITVDADVSSCQFTEVDYQDDSHACDSPTAELVKEDGRWKVFRYTEFAKEFIGGDGLP